MKCDALIIGGGPAGCTCALWLHNLGVNIALVEKNAYLGGLQAQSPYLNNWIPGIIGATGIDFAKKLDTHICSIGIQLFLRSMPSEVKFENHEIRVKLVGEKDSSEITTKHLIIATGVEAKRGGLTSAPNILFGPGHHIEEFDFRNKRVAILGGGDNAAENYGFIQAKSPSSITIFARTLRARPQLLTRIPKEALKVGSYHLDQKNLSISYGNAVQQFDIWVVMYGWQAVIPPALGQFKEKIIDNNGFIKVNEHKQTTIPRLWAIGEVTYSPYPCCITAMSDGVICAKQIERIMDDKMKERFVECHPERSEGSF